MRNGVLAIDRDGGFVLLNDEARRLFHLKPGRVEGRLYADVLHEHPDIVRVLGGAFELKSLPNRAELRLKSTDTVIGYTLSLVRDDDGDTVGAALFFKDLTHVEQIEERERLRDRLAAVGEMAAVMAHEIKNPLAGIEVLAGLLRRKVPDNADAQALVKDIISEAKMANAIVQEVLAFVRPVRLQVDRTSLPERIDAAVVDGRRQGDARQHPRRRDAAARSAAARRRPAPADAGVLQPADQRLRSARGPRPHRDRRAPRAHRRRTARCSPTDIRPSPTVVVDVSDDGPGMPPEIAEKIFNPFFTTKAQGSGLGLAIVRKIVDAHEGRIDMTTADGRGTKFRVTLPVEPGISRNRTGTWLAYL